MEFQFLQLALRMKLEMFKEMIAFESQFEGDYENGRVSALKFVVTALEADVCEVPENIEAATQAR